jgi:hypothetical protein
MAFWALAVIAGVITTLGLREGSARVEVPAGVPSAVTGSRSPELVLGGLLHTQPSATATAGILSDAWTSAAALEHALDLMSARVGVQPTPHAIVSGPRIGVPTDASAVASARASARPTGPRADHPGRGHTTTTATATAKPTHPAHGKGRPPASPPGKGAAKH